ncbi:morphogenic membrane protein MmpA [Streptomyces europaeiscabiei]|uniref:Uncharacterized protein n=1 Tax=Streptomyces europaeiscabiei TaxID=146819 RepID=A0ABU4NU94_9ACTN|nr:hypothetical protein [Streptomyces europaeiscabiei]MDX2527191.1 hypothetical protein [Streptomyces europaeiscabiei]MDX2765781.1 hypothetical protein [Streptomyces europaeiscabiei]MDX2771119.1 hypothetical protein [Streptomyces europaeiscabiei]MDX3542248.1 hypothetical protein [Streptomyces europaeiscabiei]MDX3551296.1 hypothetical protein [Streptomyces europaeiscabiei]
MTTHRAIKPAASPTQSVERAVTTGLLLAVITGLAWIGGMVYTLTGWAR